MCVLVLSQFGVGNMIGILYSTINVHEQLQNFIARGVKYFHRATGYAVLFISPYTIHLGYNELQPWDVPLFETVWVW